MQSAQAAWPKGQRNERNPVALMAEAQALLRGGYWRPALKLAEELEAWWAGRYGQAAAGSDMSMGFSIAALAAESRSQAGHYQAAAVSAERYLSLYPVSREQEQELRWLAFQARSQSEPGPEVVQTGLALLEQLRDAPRLFVQVAIRLAAVQARRGQFAPARDWLQEARAVLTRFGNLWLGAELESVAADAAVWEGDYTAALQASGQAWEQIQFDSCRPARTRVALRHLQILLLNGRVSEAAACLEGLSSLRMSCHDETVLAAVSALVMTHGGRTAQAIQELHRALSRCQSETGGSDAGREVLLVVAEAALISRHPAAEALGLALQAGKGSPGVAARAAWLGARLARARGAVLRSRSLGLLPCAKSTAFWGCSIGQPWRSRGFFWPALPRGSSLTCIPPPCRH